MSYGKYKRPKWEEPEMRDWEEDWSEYEEADDSDMRDSERLCSPLGIGLGLGFIAGFGCWPRRSCYPRYACYPRYDCYPRHACYPRYGCYPRSCYPRCRPF